MIAFTQSMICQRLNYITLTHAPGIRNCRNPFQFFFKTFQLGDTLLHRVQVFLSNLMGFIARHTGLTAQLYEVSNIFYR